VSPGRTNVRSNSSLCSSAYFSTKRCQSAVMTRFRKLYLIMRRSASGECEFGVDRP
jgi:hypothetical protein